jgi:hypothetical protein
MIIYLLALGAFFIVVLFLAAILAKRYGRSLAAKATIGIVASSFLVAFITFQVFNRNLKENTNPAIDWQRITTLETPVSKVQYRPESGLFATTEDGEIGLTGIIPFCLPEGKVAGSHPNEVEIATVPYVNLPSPPQAVKQQISFNILYPVEADASAASSFAVYENGDVWCTERFDQVGQTGAAAFGFTAFFILYLAAMIFAGTFVVLLVIVVVGLEIYRWRKRDASKVVTD